MLARIFIAIIRLSPSLQKGLWRWWYQRLAHRGRDVDWAFMNYGFTPKRQCAEVFEALRSIFSKAYEWGKPAVVLKGDVHKAFDCMTLNIVSYGNRFKAYK